MRRTLNPLGARWRSALAGGDAAVAAACVLLLLAAWMPPWTIERPVARTLVAFDITQSMDVVDAAVDGKPASRLDAAKAAMRGVLPDLPCGSEIAWGVFADYRTLALLRPVEVCAHYDELVAALDAIDGRMRWANASNVGKGVGWALRSAHAMGADTRVVFFTDGHESPPLRENEAPPTTDPALRASVGWIVGVGGAELQRIPRTDAAGQRTGYWTADAVVQTSQGSSAEHLSSLRQPYLDALAASLGLQSLKLGSPRALAAALATAPSARAVPVATDMGFVPAAAALALLVLRFFPTRPRGRSARAGSAQMPAGGAPRQGVGVGAGLAAGGLPAGGLPASRSTSSR